MKYQQSINNDHDTHFSMECWAQPIDKAVQVYRNAYRFIVYKSYTMNDRVCSKSKKSETFGHLPFDTPDEPSEALDKVDDSRYVAATNSPVPTYAL